MTPKEFEEALGMMKSSDAMTFEDGYHHIMANVEQVVDQLIEVMLQEKDPKVRGRLVELIGESSDPKIIPILAKELSHPSEDVRSWAYGKLKHSKHAEAVRIAEEHEREHPDESFL